MAHCILILLGLVILWTGIKITDEVHPLAIAFTAALPLSWGYFDRPSLFQCLSVILILSVYQLYILIVESSL